VIFVSISIVKSAAAQRESEGTIVPSIPVKQNAGEAKKWIDDFFVKQHGLYRLCGTICYPGAV